MTSNHVMLSPVTVIGYVAEDRSATPVAESSLPTGSVIAFSSLAQLDKALLAAGDTQAYLNTLTINDKVLRLRTFIEDGTITSTDFLPATITAAADPVAEVHPFGTVWVNTVTPEVFQTPGGGVWVSVWV